MKQMIEIYSYLDQVISGWRQRQIPYFYLDSEYELMYADCIPEEG